MLDDSLDVVTAAFFADLPASPGYHEPAASEASQTFSSSVPQKVLQLGFSEADPSLNNIKSAPHSLEAEQSILGGLLLDNKRWDDIADKVSTVDFYHFTKIM